MRLTFDEIKKWFNHNEWDIGYLTKEQLRICSLSPVKENIPISWLEFYKRNTFQLG